jgi:hypothetical protein
VLLDDRELDHATLVAQLTVPRRPEESLFPDR